MGITYFLIAFLCVLTKCQRTSCQYIWPSTGICWPMYGPLSCRGFTSVPNEVIDINATRLTFRYNNFSVINSPTDFKGCKFLASLDVSFNLLVEFPFLPNVASSLNVLIMNHNNIHSVNAGLTILIKLTYLDLANNFLTVFPDFYVPNLTYLNLGANLFQTLPKLSIIGKVLFNFVMSDNPLNSVEITALAHLVNLQVLGLINTNLTTLSNSCTGTGPISYTINAVGNNWNCDCRLRWILTAKKVVRNSMYPAIKCSYPPHLAGKMLYTLAPTQLTCDGKFIQYVQYLSKYSNNNIISASSLSFF